MENIDTIETWRGLLFLTFVLFLVYWVLKGFVFILGKYGKKTITNRSVVRVLKKLLIIFKPFALLVIILDFISINLITHSVLLMIISVFGYKHIKNYLNGTFLKLNPLIDKGALLEYDSHKGEIKKLLPLGIIFSTEKGERYVNYSTIEEKGFAVNSSENTALRQTLYLETELSKEEILDLLFDNPILNFQEAPSLKSSSAENGLKLQYTLESGASTEDLIAFFHYHKITIGSKNATQN
jgi:hypothetical protein